MIFSYKKLKELANLTTDVKLEDVLNAINSIGFEVEGTTLFGDVQGMKFGLIEKTYTNPEADGLTVCEIKFDDKQRTIQTTATVVEGMTVLAFVDGSKLGDITITPRELKGVMSEGMLSSLEEIGVDKEFIRKDILDKITDYKDVKDLSIDPIEYLSLQDTLIDVSILSNRSDAQSYIIMARELAAYFGTTPYSPEQRKGSLKSSINNNGKSNTKSLVLMEAKKDFDISLPEQILLSKSGIKAVNDIVDLTNLTLIMTGQPTHAYDASKVGKDFWVSYESGKYVVLGKNEVELKNNLVIINNTKVVAIAGVIGLEETKVDTGTTDFIIELGRFNIKDIRQTMKQTKVANMSSVQSSKEIALGTSTLAIAYLTSKLNNFSDVSGLDKIDSVEIPYTLKQTERIAGFDIVNHKDFKKALKALEILGYVVNKESVVVPNYRHDVKSSQDLNEEIFRFFGYDNFPLIKPNIMSSDVRVVTDIKKEVSTLGYQEAVTYSLISADKNIVNPFGFKNVTKLETFVSKEREVIRSSQAYSLLEIVEHNQKRKMEDINVFSQGMIGEGVETIAMVSTTKNFNEMKQDVINLLPNGLEFVRYEGTELHQGVSALIKLNNQVIGWIGKVSLLLTNIDVFMAEFYLQEDKHISEVATYDSTPLKSVDVTYELKLTEDIKGYIDHSLKASKTKIIDVFIKEDVKKVTVRYIGVEQAQ